MICDKPAGYYFSSSQASRARFSMWTLSLSLSLSKIKLAGSVSPLVIQFFSLLVFLFHPHPHPPPPFLFLLLVLCVCVLLYNYHLTFSYETSLNSQLGIAPNRNSRWQGVDPPGDFLIPLPPPPTPPPPHPLTPRSLSQNINMVLVCFYTTGRKASSCCNWTSLKCTSTMFNCHKSRTQQILSYIPSFTVTDDTPRRLEDPGMRRGENLGVLRMLARKE